VLFPIWVIGINDMFFTATAAATLIGIGVLLDYGIGGGWALGAMGVIFVFVAVYYKLAQNRF
jgi:hypothetical protein